MPIEEDMLIQTQRDESGATEEPGPGEVGHAPQQRFGF